MDWILLLVLCVALYAAAAYYIHKKNLWQDHITFYGPIMALRSRNVGFFDRFSRFHAFLRVYGSIGACIVVVVSIMMVVLLLLSLQYNIVQHPAPTAVNEIRNILAIPGVNQFIPFTFAVWFALMVTLVVHEFGHAILSRVENIKVKFIGMLLLVIPIGAFVEPDEEEFEKTKGVSKIRMLGAGITNNIVIGLLCFGLLIFLLGMATPSPVPLIKSVYQDYPAATAGVMPDSVVRSVNGIDVTTQDQVASILNATHPGDKVTLVMENGGVLTSYTLTLTRWPAELGSRESGFMGVTYYDAPGMKSIFDNLASPVGFIVILGIPIWIILDPVTWGKFLILVNDSPDVIAWTVPFPFYWVIVQVLFWCAWFNISVGLCNALPMIPFDGGYILKEGVERILEPKGLLKYSGNVVMAISYLMILILLLAFSLPVLLKAMGVS
jgi:membrane-associated protease RseP (regulator of RpoE activity)